MRRSSVVKSLLICGGESLLTQVRADVLRTLGLDVRAALGVVELERFVAEAVPDIFVLCSSMPQKERLRANRWISERFPAAVLITLMGGGGDSTGYRGEILPAGSPPKRLVQMVQSHATS